MAWLPSVRHRLDRIVNIENGVISSRGFLVSFENKVYNERIFVFEKTISLFG